MSFATHCEPGSELIVDLLIQDRRIRQRELAMVYETQRKDACRIEQALVTSRLVTDQDIAETYAKHLHVPLSSLDESAFTPDEQAIELLPNKLMRDALVVPMYERKRSLHVAVVDPSDLGVLHDIQLYSGLTPVAHVAPLRQVEHALDRLFGARDVVNEISLEVPSDENGLVADIGEEIVDLDKPIIEGEDTHIIRMVNHVIRQAIDEGASDIHIEPLAETVSIRFRIDGLLYARPAPPKSMFLPLLSRLKVISKMDIAEKRLAQDGAFSVLKQASQIDMRVNCVPTIYGQKMVVRILNKNALPLDLAKLGFDESQRKLFHQVAKSPHGLIFVTGPTGSGKSTTLYATLNLLNSPSKNLVTVEDPVEYKMSGINQVQTQPAIGLSFASALRAFLRQDPDVIMVGEVRDQETAEICLRAALTGHMVLSTLHTNTALAAVDRLVDMGIEPFMVGSTMRLVEAQRLIRRLCPECKEPYEPDQQTLERYRIGRSDTLFRPVGCPSCSNTGYKGRIGIFEVIQITPTLRDMIDKRAPLAALQQQAEREGMHSLMTNALAKVRLGITSLEEVIKSVQEGDH